MSDKPSIAFESPIAWSLMEAGVDICHAEDHLRKAIDAIRDHLSAEMASRLNAMRDTLREIGMAVARDIHDRPRR